MRVVWLSANLFGLRLLEEAVKHVDISSIITLSDQAKTTMYDGVNKKRWYKFGIDVHEVEDINKDVSLITKLDPDLIVMCGWRQVLSQEILKIPKIGVVGFHPTMLPKGRGAAPLINTLLQGFIESGVTMFFVTSGIDDGDIIDQIPFTINNDDHASEVYQKIIAVGKLLVSKNLQLLITGDCKKVGQDINKATIFEKPHLKDNRIDLEKESINQIYRKIKALSKPYQGAYIEKDGKRLIIWRAEIK